jgi:hypothetical protein
MTDEGPRIILPPGFQDKSGLYLPSSFGPQHPQVAVPPDLPRPFPSFIVVGRAPSLYDQVYAYATEEEMGLDATSSDDVVAIAKALPFWASIRFLARFQRDLWHVRLEQDGQIALLNQWFAGSRFATHAEAWLRQEGQRVLFSEQQVFTLQRLIFLHSRDGSLDDNHTRDEYVGLLAALIAVPGSILGSVNAIGDHENAPVADERWMQLFVGHGGFVGRGSLRNELGRAYRLYEEVAASETAASHPDCCPLSMWLVEEYDLSFAELQAAAFALHAGSKMLEEQELPALVDESYFAKTRLADKSGRALEVLSAPREWFVERFESTQGDPRRAAFEITPFLHRPALRQPDGKVMPIAPRALEAWMGATGNYYRLFDIARGKGSETRKRFTRFNGALVETYVAETAERAYPPPGAASAIWLPGRVFREQVYRARGSELRTPDIAIDLTPDLVIIEVTSSRLTERSVVDADPDAVRRDIEKVVIDKVEQLGRGIADLRSGVAKLPDFDMAAIDRIWPIVVGSEGILQTPTLWAFIDNAVERSLDQPKVQTLTLLDLEDVEELFGLVIEGHSIVDVLRAKTSELWRDRELAIWMRQGGSGLPDRSPIAEDNLASAFEAVAVALFEGEDRERLARLKDEIVAG